MSEKTQTIGEVSMWGGSATACAATAHPSFLNGDPATMAISLGGLCFAALGFAYTVWNGERMHKLRVQELELARLERAMEKTENKGGRS